MDEKTCAQYAPRSQAFNRSPYTPVVVMLVVLVRAQVPQMWLVCRAQMAVLTSVFLEVAYSNEALCH